MSGSRGSQHAEKAITVRPPAALREDAKAKLRAHGRDMNSFLVACMAAFAADPGSFLDQLGAHWPPPKPYGRPLKRDARGAAPNERQP
jgi:hypothetical protein